jgi:deazaflavin-dependent oxidoreductase (nitroreductase family)
MTDNAKLPGWITEHIALYEKDPDAGHMWDSSALGGPGVLPTLLLTTTGAKSGQPRVLPLIYGKRGDDVVIIASKGGAPSHPAWFVNLEANPACRVQVARDVFDATARIAEGEERKELWEMMVDVYSPYTDYQNATAREIPVVVLERS